MTKLNKYFQKAVCSLIILSMVVGVPYFRFAQKAEAQGVQGYIKGIAPAITQLPLCKNKIQGLFSGVGRAKKVLPVFVYRADDENSAFT